MTSFRLDRFLTLRFFHPLVRSKGLTGEPRIPVLMYHSISDERESGSHPYYHIHTSPAVFAAQMQYLADHSYTVIDLRDIQNCSDENTKLAKKFVAITFDDGYRDFYSNAFPILQRLRFPATVFLPTDFIGNRYIRLRGKEHLSWSQVAELSSCGIMFGSHTVSHPQLRDLGTKEIQQELRDSKKSVEDKIGKPVTSFSYPFAFPEEDEIFRCTLKNMLENEGYRHGATTILGRFCPGDDPLFVKRIPINDADDQSLFSAKIEGGYDWLKKPQHFFKIAKRRLQKIA